MHLSGFCKAFCYSATRKWEVGLPMKRLMWSTFAVSAMFAGAGMVVSGQAVGSASSVHAGNSKTATTVNPQPSKDIALPSARGGYTLSYVKSDRKWRFGFRSEPFNKVSAYLEDQLADNLGRKGLRRVPDPQDSVYNISFELLEVTIHPAYIKKPGMDVSATLTVKDFGNHLLFSKGYRGESRTMMNTYGHLINHAVEDVARKVADDDDLIAALTRRTAN